MPKGGKRQGAGRPAKTGKFGIKTKTIRVPENLVDVIYSFINLILKNKQC